MFMVCMVGVGKRNESCVIWVKSPLYAENSARERELKEKI